MFLSGVEMDGHTGIKSHEVNRGGKGDFQLVLSYLKESDGSAHFIIHATPKHSYLYGLQPLDFLELIGFNHFKGECQFFGNRCYYRHLGYVKYDHRGFENIEDNQYIHSAFEKFANEGIDKLFELRKQEKEILRSIGSSSGPLKIFDVPVEIEIKPSDIPGWVNSIKFEKLKELEKERSLIEDEINNLSEYLPLLYADGEQLLCAVEKALKQIGLKTERTAPGFTVDILAETIDGLKKFGFEVTGTTEAIKKESKKLTQLIDFERIKKHGEKTILIANTYKNIPIPDRKDNENFTQQVVDFLSPFKILMMTSWDIYRIIEKIINGEKSGEHYINRFYSETGVFNFNE